MGDHSRVRRIEETWRNKATLGQGPRHQNWRQQQTKGGAAKEEDERAAKGGEGSTGCQLETKEGEARTGEARVDTLRPGYLTGKRAKGSRRGVATWIGQRGANGRMDITWESAT